MINLNEYKANVYSQNGEDGIIRELYNHIDPTGFVIEFGAADGLFVSNTAALWKDGPSRALLIESDRNLYEKLRQYYSDRVTTLNALVENLEDFTTEVADVCSMDVDGCEYQILAHLVTRHQILVVEYNPTAPPHVEMIHVEGTAYGSSAKPLVRLAEDKGYTLVAVTATNLIFLYGDHRDTFVSDLPTLFDYSNLNYIVTAYDGQYDMIGKWAYGMSQPCDMRLAGRPYESVRSSDTQTQEYVRFMMALEDGKKV